MGRSIGIVASLANEIAQHSAPSLLCFLPFIYYYHYHFYHYITREPESNRELLYFRRNEIIMIRCSLAQFYSQIASKQEKYDIFSIQLFHRHSSLGHIDRGWTGESEFVFSLHRLTHQPSDLRSHSKDIRSRSKKMNLSGFHGIHRVVMNTTAPVDSCAQRIILRKN